jgi:NitT/TauT family transport system substrate-binding protein
MKIILQETLRGIFYAPFYAALALGAYEDEGLEVVLKTSERPDDAVRSVIEGSADLSWGGPMRVIVGHDRDPHSELVCFCEAVTRDPFFLIGDTPIEEFTFDKLLGVKLAIVSEVPTPWFCLQEDVRRAGLDPLRIQRASTRTMGENADLLGKDGLSVVQVLEPFAEELIASGRGHMWYAAAKRGHATYTCFYTRRQTLESRRVEFTAMTRAIFRVQRWMQQVDAGELAGILADYFPNVPIERLTSAVGRYLSLGVWGKNPVLPRSGFDLLKAGMISSGGIKSDLPFEKAVDNSLAEAVMAQIPPPLRPRHRPL